MEIDTWISSCKVRIFPWIDGKRIYCNVRYFEPGASLEKPPAWDKSVYITDDEKGRNLAYNFTSTLVNNIARIVIPQGKEVTLTVN